MKKLLFLGGSDIQVPGIKYAQSKGYKVITCDYLPENPGHKISDGYYNVSTTNLEGVLEIAQKENIDAIIAYASDPSALTASYVSEKMGLRGVPFEAAKILSNKNLFRDFLQKNGFLYPLYAEITSGWQLQNFVEEYGKSIIKPVDSSGSKGIQPVDKNSDYEYLYEEAKRNSRSGTVIVERFIQRKGNQMCGDVAVLEGELIFAGWGNVHFDDFCDPVTPCSITLPANNGEEIIRKTNTILQKIFSNLGVQLGTFNVDVIIDEDDNIYIVEIGARNGGNLFTELITHQSGFDLVGITFASILEDTTKKDLEKFNIPKTYNYCAHYVLHSRESGIFEDAIFSEEIEKNIFYKNVKVKKGDQVRKFGGSNDRLGLCLLGFQDYSEMISKVKNFKDYVKIKLS